MHKEYLQTAEEKLNAAKYLFNGEFYNDAVSRAYYSMFYSAKALLSVKEIYPKAHKGVIAKFGLEFVKKGFIEDTYGRALSHAKDRREVADYDIGKKISQKETSLIIEDAKNFLERIKIVINELENK
ncbi:MAG: HEPN domain-containing protein [Methanobacteriaceae archaeon]|nr:HEPN domain-containing protein [Methanobacteriaceae archaeon]MDP2836324.1 HEPN domain-containing protein [Methanobacteriaceae archaeon]MDP3484744.1 HEPN domain-containing protein [Methanobacteriaceae archaeon]